MRNLLPLLLASLAAAISIAGAAGFMTSQAANGSAVWPLPGLVLLDWAIIGFIAPLVVYLEERSTGRHALDILWGLSGGLLPMVYLGAFSIGLFVLLSALPLLTCCAVLTLSRKQSWLRGLGFLATGLLLNLVVLLVFIALGR